MASQEICYSLAWLYSQTLLSLNIDLRMFGHSPCSLVFMIDSCLYINLIIRIQWMRFDAEKSDVLH